MKSAKNILEWLSAITGLLQPALPLIVFVAVASYAYLNEGLENIARNDDQAYFLLIALLSSLFVFVIVNFALTIVTFKIHHKYKKLASVSSDFRASAFENALCDKQLFHNLFISTNSQIMESDNYLIRSFTNKINRQIVASRELCYNNIQQIFLRSSAIFTGLTGDSCSITLKALQDDQIVCIRRDPVNAVKRSNKLDEGHKVDENTPFYEIMHHGTNYYINDNLKKSQKKGSYHNIRKDYWKYYNACLVYCFKVSVETIEYTYFLCIDNQKGGFLGDGVLDAAAEICERLSVMNHRLLSLEAIIKQLNK